jgi:tripartite-type tricarboxylate transporter receptor subunit TctC
MFKMITGVSMRHIPYKGTILALNDLIAGQVHVVFSDMPIALPHTNTGKVRALAVTSGKRTPLLPNMPTVAEGGVPGYAIENSWGLFVPRNVPPPIVIKLNSEVVRIHQLQDVKDRYAVLGLEAATSSPDQFRRYIEAEAAKYSKIIKATGAKVD